MPGFDDTARCARDSLKKRAAELPVLPGHDASNPLRLQAISCLTHMSAGEIARIIGVRPWEIHEWAADFEMFEARARGERGVPECRWHWHLDHGPELMQGITVMDHSRQWDMSTRVIFMDFGGVLSRDEFFARERKPGHPLKDRLDSGMHDVWHAHPEVSRSWMRGEITFEQAVREMRMTDVGPGYLREALQEGARQMEIHTGLMELLPAWSTPGFLILATDNVAPFAQAFREARRGRPGRDATMANAAPWFDGVISSSDLGVLKREDPSKFFGEWLAAHGSDWPDALLIDDRTDNCEAFREAGGTAIQWAVEDDAKRLAEPVRAWLAHARIL